MDLRIIVVTDLHSNLDSARRLGYIVRESYPDLLLIAGDITHYGTLKEVEEIIELLKLEDTETLFIPGNCDPKDLLQREEIGGSYNIHGKSFNFRGITIFGIGGSPPTPFNTLIESPEEEIRKILSSFETSSSSIILSHFPPYNTELDRVFFGHHVGSFELRKLIDMHNSRLVVVGHIHEARGKQMLNATQIVNPGPGNRGFYASIHLRSETIDVTLNQI